MFHGLELRHLEIVIMFAAHDAVGDDGLPHRRPVAVLRVQEVLLGVAAGLEVAPERLQPDEL